MFSRRSRLISVTCVLNDLFATAVAFLLAYGIRVLIGQRHWVGLHAIYPLKVYLPIFAAAALLIPFFGYLLGAYHQLELRRPRDIASDVTKMMALGLLALFTGMFFFKGEYVSRSLLLIFVLLQFVLLAASRRASDPPRCQSRGGGALPARPGVARWAAGSSAALARRASNPVDAEPGFDEYLRMVGSGGR